MIQLPAGRVNANLLIPGLDACLYNDGDWRETKHFTKRKAYLAQEKQQRRKAKKNEQPTPQLKVA